jgi:hypothetical protein
MDSATPSKLHSYLRHRRKFEVAMWVAFALFWGAANALTASMDMRRHALPFDRWEPFVWEYSSLAILIVLVLAQIAFDRRFPVRIDSWRRSLLAHLFATVPYSLVHVVGMVMVRQLIYSAVGERYQFGDWSEQLWYEYLKDARSYAVMLAIVYLYRLVLLRLQGEASLLTAPETASSAPEPIDRPDRFLVRKLGAEFLIESRDIEWLEAAENYVNLHVRGRVYPLRSTMAAIIERLDPELFVRVHRSFILNRSFLDKIEPLESGDARLLLKNGHRIPCSRRHRESLKGSLSTA